MQEIPKKFSTHTVGIAAAIIEKGGKILLVKENRPHLQGHAKWHHPAGWIDKGENLIDAVIREAKEETGFEFAPAYLIGIYSLYREDFNLHPIKFVFAGAIPSAPSGSFNPDEILEIKFFFPEEIYSMDNKMFFDADEKQIIKDYFSGKKYPLEIIHHEIQK
jgi:ADP-ribose pyrophosphatase YjhB (NUDIX family)